MLDYSKKPLVMGVLNATPDSFSDGGKLADNKQMNEIIHGMIAAGVDILDVGGESARPGHIKISAYDEINRVLPVIQVIRRQSGIIPISIDTQKAKVAEAALEAGATLVNDVSALSDPDMPKVIKDYNCQIILMRNAGLVQNVIFETRQQFEKLVGKAKKNGIRPDQIILDPGLGFGDLKNQNYSALPGSNVEANLALIRSIDEYSLNFPVLIGASRKRFVGEMMNEDNPKKRISGSVELAVLAAKSGASIVRVHDVRETIEALGQT